MNIWDFEKKIIPLASLRDFYPCKEVEEIKVKTRAGRDRPKEVKRETGGGKACDEESASNLWAGCEQVVSRLWAGRQIAAGTQWYAYVDSINQVSNLGTGQHW